MGAKVKVGITLSRDILDRIDAEAAAEPGGTRSGVIERWLRSAVRVRNEATLREETIRYYESLDEAERSEDTAIAHAGSRLATKVRYD